MNTNESLGGLVHTYLGYDPMNFPSPTAEPPDLASEAMNHLLQYGNTRQLTPEELANAVKIDPRQIRGLGASLDNIAAQLEERKRKILERYETEKVQADAKSTFHDSAANYKPPKKIAEQFTKAVKEEQYRDLENLYYASGRDRDSFSKSLIPLLQKLGNKYQIDAMAGKYNFTGKEALSITKALDVYEELQQIDKLLEQIKEAMKNARIGIIDMEELSEFINDESMADLRALQQQINEYLKQQAEQQGISQDRRGFQLSPKAYRLFQSKLLQTIFADLAASKTGRHSQAVIGEGAVESQRTKEYEFGDSVTQMDIPASMINAMLRNPKTLPVRMSPEDIVIHRTQVTPKAATAVLLDMSGSMRYGEQYVNVKRMALGLDGLIRTEFPGDFLQFIEMYTFAKPTSVADLPKLMPKPVTIYDPVVRMRADMSDPNVSEMQIPPHFTNIQHAIQLGRKFLSRQDTPNRQMIIITDGLPTAHFEDKFLYLLYPPDPRTENATLREALLCAKENITINIFLLQNWNQTEEDVRFAYRMAESTKGRVIFTAGQDLDRFVIWDYVKHKKSIIG